MHIKRKHDFGAEEAKIQVDKVAGDLEKRFSLTSERQGNHLVFRGDGVKGKVSVADSSIDRDVELGLASTKRRSALPRRPES